ncbi:dioxygenase [Bifidobacterium eulemuris]|nr:dioxygenase [Bifidobacterium eulemuris]
MTPDTISNPATPSPSPRTSMFSPSEGVAMERHTTLPSVTRTVAGNATVEGRLTSPVARVPESTARCGGITVKGHTLKTFAYTTDAAVIRNTNASAILAVYPFTGEPIITQALLTVAQQPLFVGVGGGTTTGNRVIELAMVAEMQGAAGVVINAPAPAATVEAAMSAIDIPVIATVTTDDEVTEEKILAGAAIINVAAGHNTAAVVASIRAHHPETPILASGGASDESIIATIEAGADAVTWTPPSAQQLQSQMMARYRGES